MLRLYTQETYFKSSGESGYSSYDTQRESLKSTFRRFLRQLHKRGDTGGRLLEVGCGYGFLLEEAATFFEDRVGTDYSTEALQQAAKSGARVIQGGAAEVPEGEKFDVIITVGVIEHVYNPIQFTQRLKSHLVEGGRLIHATPHMGSFWRHLMGRRWTSFKVPEHITYYDKYSLAKLFNQSGFGQLAQLSFPHAFPISLIAEKLGVKIGGSLGRLNLWLPATTLAMIGVKSDSAAHEMGVNHSISKST